MKPKHLKDAQTRRHVSAQIKFSSFYRFQNCAGHRAYLEVGRIT